MFARSYQIKLLEEEIIELRKEFDSLKEEYVKRTNPFKWNIGDKIGKWIITDRGYKKEMIDEGWRNRYATKGKKEYDLTNTETGQVDRWVDENKIPSYYIK